MDIGSVRLTERHLRDDPPTPEQVAAAEADTRAALTVARAAVPVAQAATFVGVAGSITTIAGVALGLDHYDSARIHHCQLTTAQVNDATELLLRSGREQRAAHTVIHPGRVDVIAAGALILRVIMSELGLESMVVSEHDILDGLAASLYPGP
jgi:exopolyphosphatase/guanosine-5'-triphosphate,3'-diphosphate pyrophosphatase